MNNEQLQDLSLEELAQLKQRAEAMYEEKLAAQKEDLLKDLKAKAAMLGYTLTKITKKTGGGQKKPHPNKGKTLPITHRDPNDPKNTWTGRSAKPNWLLAYLEQGRHVDEFKIS